MTVLVRSLNNKWQFCCENLLIQTEIKVTTLEYWGPYLGEVECYCNPGLGMYLNFESCNEALAAGMCCPKNGVSSIHQSERSGSYIRLRPERKESRMCH